MNRNRSTVLLRAILDADEKTRREIIKFLESMFRKAPISIISLKSMGAMIYGETVLEIIENADLEDRKGVALVIKPLFPGSGTCGRCDLPFYAVEGHSTDYRGGEGCFPLCEKCWSELTPKERLPFYEQLWKQWKERNVEQDYLAPERWQQIKKAVLAGK